MKRSALITGGSRGIGLGIATELAEAGFNIAINGVRPEEMVRDVMESLRKFGGKVIYCQGDVASAAARVSMVEKIKSEFGALHVLVNNAGIAPKERKDILEAS